MPDTPNPTAPSATPGSLHVSHALFIAPVRDRTNAILEQRSGLKLVPSTAPNRESGTLLPLDVWDTKTNTPLGITLTPSNGASALPTPANGLAVRTVGVTVWEDAERVDTNRVDTKAVLRSISAAEDAAHEQVHDTTRPDPRAMTHEMASLPSHVKGRLAGARWHQDAGTEDGPIPPANAVRALHFERRQQFRHADGTFLRVPDEGTLLVDTKGTFTTPQPGHRIVPLMDIKPNATAQEAQSAAALVVEARTAIRGNMAHDATLPRLASVEHEGRGLVVGERQDGVVMTMRTYASPAYAARGLHDQNTTFVGLLDRENRQLTDINRVARAFRQDAR